MSKHSTFVTALVFNAEDENASGSTIWYPDIETLEAAKEQAYEVAVEQFHNYGYADAVGVIYHVTTVATPKLPSVTIKHEGAIEPVTIETVE